MDPQLRHIVCIKFRDGVTPTDREKVEEEFCALMDKIPQVLDLEWGTNISHEPLDKGLTHCFILTFASEKDRDEYLIHPAHEAFVELLQKHSDDLLVLDFWKNSALFREGTPTV
jgi:hypothetical protein